MVIDKILKMTVKGVKLKSESFFLISPVVLELRRKNFRGADWIPPPPPRHLIGLNDRMNHECASMSYEEKIQ